jgi:hypothetical protein
MKKHYNFKNAVVGKHYHPADTLEISVYLEPEVRDKLAAVAENRGTDVGSLVNTLLKKELEAIANG